MNNFNPKRLWELASNEEKANKKLVKKIKSQKKNASFNKLVQELHEEYFKETDCLQCANCCKNISPIIYEKDIQRISKQLKMRPAIFTETYLKVDKEGDYVFKNAPCPFLQNDNYCMIYEVRPKSCREYPHTDHKNFDHIIKKSIKNTFICPVVYKVFKKLRISYLK
jgi:hypothetical protein